MTIQALHLLGLKGSGTHAGQSYPAMTGLGPSCNLDLEGQSNGALNASEQTECVRSPALKQAEEFCGPRIADFFWSWHHSRLRTTTCTAYLPHLCHAILSIPLMRNFSHNREAIDHWVETGVTCTDPM